MILNQFFHFYCLNMYISPGILFLGMKLCILRHRILLEGSVFNFDLGLSFLFYVKNGKLFVNFLNFIF